MTTRWTMVGALRGPSRAGAATALEWLCQRYWYPIYAHTRRLGHGAEEAKDLVQSFFARLIERGTLGEAEAERGRFRSYLLGCLDHFLADERRRAQRQKRGGGAVMFSLDDPAVEARLAGDLAAEGGVQGFDRLWAAAVFHHALERLRGECEEREAAGRFEALRGLLTGEATEPQAQIAAQLGMNAGALKVALHRLRARFREFVREEVATTVEGEGGVDDEVQHLLAALRS